MAWRAPFHLSCGRSIPFVSARFLLPHLPKGAKVISDATLADARATVPATAGLGLGTIGITKTPLRPSGKAVFAGKTVDVSSRAGFIEAGKQVEVCRIDGNIIVVRTKEAPAPGTASVPGIGPIQGSGPAQGAGA